MLLVTHVRGSEAWRAAGIAVSQLGGAHPHLGKPETSMMRLAPVCTLLRRIKACADVSPPRITSPTSLTSLSTVPHSLCCTPTY